MWYPNRAQWWVIWVVAAIVCIGLAGGYEETGLVLDVVIDHRRSIGLAIFEI
jgi:hypothetical protein